MPSSLKVTPSQFDSLTPRYAREIVARALAPDLPEFTNQALEDGKNFESLAAQMYMELNLELVIKPTEPINHPTLDYVAGTPDGLVGSDGIIEIKCPQYFNHMEYLMQQSKQAKKYMKQIQGYLWITGRKWCDLITFNPYFSEKYRYQQMRINRDNWIIQAISEEVTNFYHSELKPLLIKFGLLDREYKVASSVEIVDISDINFDFDSMNIDGAIEREYIIQNNA